MTRIVTSIIAGTITKEFTITSGLSRIIPMVATMADLNAISKGHIGSGAITTTTITIMTVITTDTREM
jgi:sugar (pentulose or hexulose) kinase